MPDAARRLVLVVDDDFDVRDALTDVLQMEGIPAAFVADGLEALEWLQRNPAPCLILLDWMMPRCDGATFRAQQRSDPTIAEIPVVLLTADVRLEEKTRVLGVQAYLRKPVDFDRLSAVIRRYCDAA
jgi:two-component system chemotaxis response regulator CheY